MSNNIFILTLSELPLGGCREALQCLEELMLALAEACAAPYVRLSMRPDRELAGTFAVSAECHPDREAALVALFVETAEALASGRQLESSGRVAAAAAALRDIDDRAVYPIVLGTSSARWTIEASPTEMSRIPPVESWSDGQKCSPSVGGYDVVRGTIQGFDDHHGLTMYLYDVFYDARVECALQRESYESVFRYWGHMVEIRGLIRRRTPAGRPVSISNIRAFLPVSSEPQPRVVLRGRREKRR